MAMNLCRELGFTLGQLLENMSSAEFTMWLGLFRAEAKEEAERQVRARAASKARGR